MATEVIDRKRRRAGEWKVPKRFRRAAAWIVTLLLLAGTVACSSASRPPPAPASPGARAGHVEPGHCSTAFRGASPASHRPAWIISESALKALQRSGLPTWIIRAQFNRPSTVLLASKGQRDPLAPKATLAADYPSAASLAAALHRGAVPASVSFVLLDLEDWPQTPVREQLGPIPALRDAVAAVRRPVLSPWCRSCWGGCAGQRILYTRSASLTRQKTMQRGPA